MLPLSLLLTCLPVAQALSWPYAPTAHRSSSMESTKDSDGPTPAEIAAIMEASTSLNAYANKPDCFRRAVGVVQTRCGELETNESERVKAALSMTLCEIATAEDHSPPLECAHFQAGIADQRDASPGKCVSALSRSAQYWSSYSGYLREVSQLCFAFHRWNDIGLCFRSCVSMTHTRLTAADTAREVHRNATVETIAMLRWMSDREKRMQASWDESNAVLSNMRAIVDRLHASAAAVDVASSTATERLSVALSEMTGAYNAATLEFHEREASRQAEKLSEIDAAISRALNQLTAATFNVAPTVERVLVQHLDTAFSSLTRQLDIIGAQADQAGSSLMLFERTFGEFQDMTTTLVADVRQAGADMEVHLRNSHTIQEKQLESVKAAEDVSSVLSALVVNAHVGMQELNGTISEVKHSLRGVYHQDWASTLRVWFQEAALQFLRIHPGQPLFQVLSAIVNVLRVLVALTSSSLMSAVVLLTSVRKLLPKDRRPAETQVSNSIFPAASGTTRARTRTTTPGSATEACSADLASPSLAAARLPSDSVSERLSDSTNLRRRPRLSRIPDRLCNRSLR
ncbi:hypothetical protein OH76DRAFT_986290 [Lentinus brumalis]|uniref:Nuclear fusion protein KAR5 n=1 Tax=Lentinus brumalis TaxID=2498619 RepID=A0A371DQ85_9APHY|nr:hypothetical protein OH76DRAFT_986290 [Polyporus brumalis]